MWGLEIVMGSYGHGNRARFNEAAKAQQVKELHIRGYDTCQMPYEVKELHIHGYLIHARYHMKHLTYILSHIVKKKKPKTIFKSLHKI